MLFNVISWKKFKQVKQDGWQSISDVKVDYDTIMSAGFSVEEDSDKITMASHVNGELVNGVYFIPKTDILSRTVLTATEIKEFKNWLSKKEEETKDDTVTVTVEPISYSENDAVFTAKAVKELTLTETLKSEKETVMEVPSNFHGIDVKEFLSVYDTMTHKKLVEYFKSSSQIVYTLSYILRRLGVVSTKKLGSKSKGSDTEVVTTKVTSKLGSSKRIGKKSFKATVNLKEFKKDVKTLGIKDLCAKYQVSDYTIYDAIHFYELNDYEKGHRRVLKKPVENSKVSVEKEFSSKINMLLSKKNEIAKLAKVSTQGYLAKKYGVSTYTMHTALRRMGIQSAGRN